MRTAFVKLAGLVATVACWYWAVYAQRSNTSDILIIVCAPLLAYPITLAGRKMLDRYPTARAVDWTNIVVHYAMMIALGIGIFTANRFAVHFPGVALPIPPQLGRALVLITGAAAFLTVLNLAIRGLGAPFAAIQSSRLATDWMYTWTRNPMLLATLALLVALGMFHRSLWFLVWIAFDVSPPWILFVLIYEERELEIRFGATYEEYRARTPFLWPRRPRLVQRVSRSAGA